MAQGKYFSHGKQKPSYGRLISEFTLTLNLSRASSFSNQQETLHLPQEFRVSLQVSWIGR